SIHLTPVLVAIFALLLFARERNNAGSSQSAPNYDKPAAIVLLLATVALLLYAMYGIDDLNYNYIGLFYYAVPGFTVALIVASLMMPRSRITKVIVALIVAGAALPYTLRQAAIPTAYAPNYHDARIAPYFGQVLSLKNGVIALDLDNSKDWGPIWSTLLGIEIYAARHETEQLFCINKNWHISFGVNARCTEQQLLQGNRYVVSTSTQFAESLHQSSAIDLGGIRFYKFHAPTLAQNQILDVASNQTLYASSVLNKGWSIPDGNFVWSEGSNATLAVNVDPQLSSAQLKLDMSAFLPKPGSQQQVAVFINHIEAGNIHFDTNNNRGVRAFKLLPGMAEKAGPISVEFRIREPLSPQSAGLGADPRMLGIALYSIAVGE
ncbi:MAG TPA: hypothetical protein VLC91_14795, partial [Spongiibacteraceae bacterium]|nr:hypothetical protein [Spongiibacteraceae bacterium]